MESAEDTAPRPPRRERLRGWWFDVLQAAAPLALLIAPFWLSAELSLEPKEAFRRAILDASGRHRSQVVADLVAIRPGQPGLVWHASDPDRLLVAKFMSAGDARQYYPIGEESSADRLIWVTVPSQIRELCSGPGLTDRRMRLLQYLGLSPTADYDTVVEMWVRGDDLIRPCPDPEIDDRSCNPILSDADPPEVDVAGFDGFEDFYFSLFEAYQTAGAPWTGLGYTYDWAGGRRRVGASEFVLKPGRPYEAAEHHTVDAYCAPGASNAGGA